MFVGMSIFSLLPRLLLSAHSGAAVLAHKKFAAYAQASLQQAEWLLWPTAAAR